MQRNTIDHTKDLFRLAAYVIDAIFGVDIRNTLLTMDEVGIQQIVHFANQAMIDVRSQAQSELMRSLWDDPEFRENFTTKRNDPNSSWKDFSDLIKALWANPNHVFNLEQYRDKLSEAMTGRSWTLTGPRHQPPPGVVVMQPCGYCGQLYHFRKLGQHQNQCAKNPDNV